MSSRGRFVVLIGTGSLVFFLVFFFVQYCTRETPSGRSNLSGFDVPSDKGTSLKPYDGILQSGSSDTLHPDPRRLTLQSVRINNSPRIISPDFTEASGGIPYEYIVRYVESDGPDTVIEFVNIPPWLSPSVDTLAGIPPDGARDSNFLVIVSDGLCADTQMVWIDVIPCLVVYGDSRTGHTQHQQIVNLIRGMQPRAVFHTGDLVNNGLLQSDWDIFNSIVSEMLAESDFYPALGNHEYQSPLYFANFELPNNEQWYSVDIDRLHFIILNSCCTVDAGSEQYQWLSDDLSAIDTSIEYTIAVFHHPPYSTGNHAEDERGLRGIWVPLFEQYGVDIVFNGHDHDYERSFCNGIYYIVAGGGGAPLRDQTRSHPCSRLFIKDYHFCKLSHVEARLIVKMYDIDAVLIDQFELTSD